MKKEKKVKIYYRLTSNSFKKRWTVEDENCRYLASSYISKEDAYRKAIKRLV